MWDQGESVHVAVPARLQHIKPQTIEMPDANSQYLSTAMTVISANIEGRRLQTTQHTSEELLRRLQTDMQIVSKPPAPSNGAPIFRFWGKPAMQTRWMAGTAPHKSG